MTGEHASEQVLERMARRELGPDAFLATAKHLESCPACAAKARARASRDLGALRRELTAAPPRRRGHIASIAAAAAIAAALAVGFIVTRDDPAPPVVTPPPRTATVASRPAPPPPAPQTAATYADAEWQRLVDEARASGRLPFPGDLDELRGSPEVLRGEGRESLRVSPAGIVVEDPRPAFTWTARGSKTYVVFVFDGEREVARSGELRGDSWRPDRDLPRGRILSWQVEAGEGEELETIPRPPAPPAKFRIVSDRDRRDIERARALHPDDALLHAVLYARAGLREKALDAFRR